MKKLLAITAIAAGVLALATSCQKGPSDDLFKPYKATDLRSPAVPVFVTDPYISIWSTYDNLNEGPTRHWTGDEKPLQGFVRVDGKTYRFLGSETDMFEEVLPMATEWQGRMSRTTPPADWAAPDFDATAWEQVTGPVGSEGGVNTRWADHNSDAYVIREVELTPEQLDGDMELRFSHDDEMWLYINGTQVHDTGDNYIYNEKLVLTPEMKALLKPGRNVVAARCHNGIGGAHLDYGLYSKMRQNVPDVAAAVQKSCDVTATSSYYTFTAGPVDLNVVFTAPMLIDDYDLLSSPINYVSYKVVSNDGKDHDVQLMLTAEPLIAQNRPSQPTISTIETVGGVKYARTGTIQQPILAKKGDHICIDWGYLYIPAINGEVAISDGPDIMNTFASKGTLPEGQQDVKAYEVGETPVLAYVHDFGKTKDASSFAMLGYDEVYDIQYFYKPYKAYWAHNGDVTIYDMFGRMNNDYASIMKRCKELDKTIYDEAEAVGGKKLAELLSSNYRLVIAAHKLFVDDQGNLLFFSKENDSNGCVNTVDLTYPEAPLFLCYNPELQKAMMTSILDYAKSGRWDLDYAAHDLGTYPIANGNIYGGESRRKDVMIGMPVEESGNMLTLIGMISDLDGNTEYADKYWDVLTRWTDYLVENGLDPANQLCTDDFTGHLARNVNLAAKAIMGIAAYARMAEMRGDHETAEKYMNIARDYGKKWEEMAREDDHYRLAYDRPDTWSMKYNMIWDKIWDTNIFPNDAMKREFQSYAARQNKYGMPLDYRANFTKSDWYMWCAAMADSRKDLDMYVDHIYDYANETPSRGPLSDWYDTSTGERVHFIGRSVIGGHWMPVLVNRYSPYTQEAGAAEAAK